jgi:PTH1 family peptidyl-tRNA hydrolase
MGMDRRPFIVGLGNPGAGYREHRHNVGFMVVEELARRRGLRFAEPDRRWAEAADPLDGLVLLKPLTYMNLSGEAVAAWGARRHPDGSAPVPLVVCDDLALPLGSLRLRARGSSGGQNGLASIIAVSATEDIPRLRLGVAPLAAAVDPADWADFVLQPFAAGERTAAAAMVRAAADALETWLAEGLEAAVARHNRRVRRPEPEAPAEDPGAGAGDHPRRPDPD